MKEYTIEPNESFYSINYDDQIIYFDNEYDEYKEEKENNKEIIVNGEWCVPMPTRKDVITDKKFNYELLGEIILISNRKTEFLEGIDISDAEQHRYIYEKGTNSILSNKDFLERISKTKFKTIKTNLKKLANANNEVVSYCQDEKGRAYYKIMPYTTTNINGKEIPQYVRIDSRILEYLCNVYNSNAIKVYCVLLWKLWDNEKKCYVKKQLTYDWLLKQIGLSGSNGGKNSKMLSDILENFKDVGLIKRSEAIITEEKKGENTIVKRVYYYEISEDFLAKKNKK